jgi:citrate lyase beta subunit
MVTSLPADLLVVPEPRPAPLAATRAAHVLYGGAHLFKATSLPKLGGIAEGAFRAHGDALGEALGVSADVVERVGKKLGEAPIEAFCIDFEDGFGVRTDEEEDREAVRAADDLAQAEEGPLVGIRVKALDHDHARRAARTLDLFVTAFAEATGRKLRPGFTVTLPKVETEVEVASLVALLLALETSLGIPRIDIELMIETPSAVARCDALVRAAGERCVALHLGAYDLTASHGVMAGDQRLDHPYCDLARAAMTATGVLVYDGATTLLPIGERDQVIAGWKEHAANVRRALALGIGQGWDLHPAQLPARWAALFAYFHAQRDEVAARLAKFGDRAMRTGQTFDDAATIRGLVTFFRRGLACGAFREDEIPTLPAAF